MSFLSAFDFSEAVSTGTPDPFVSLPAGPALSQRSWLVELVIAPFRDLDERAHYTAAKRAAAREGAAGAL